MTTRRESYPVLARGHETLPDESTVILSEIDQVIPGNHTTPCMVYPLPKDTLTKEQLISHLRSGLENVLTNVPLVGSVLHETAEGGICALRQNHEPIQLHVHHLDLDPSLPSYQYLEEHDFDPGFFNDKGELLTPEGINVGGFRRDEGCPVALFQANFIRGGIILALSFHHMCGDAKSIDNIYVYWAASTKAAVEGKPLPVWKPSLDRTYFNAAYTPDAAETEKLKKNIRGFTYHPISKDDSGKLINPPERPPTSNKIYRISAASCAKLKEMCKPSEAGKFVSSYDCVSALTWRCITRSRVPFLGIDVEKTESSFSHAVDVRGKWAGQVSPDYVGNGFLVTLSDSIPLKELIESPNLARIAETIRHCTTLINENSIPDLVKVRQGIEGKEEMRWIWHPQNVVGTSWTGMRAYTEYDFGFGLPMTIRLPLPAFEGVFGVMPATRIDGKVDGLEVYVVQENGCHERLAADEEYRKFADLLG